MIGNGCGDFKYLLNCTGHFWSCTIMLLIILLAVLACSFGFIVREKEDREHFASVPVKMRTAKKFSTIFDSFIKDFKTLTLTKTITVITASTISGIDMIISERNCCKMVNNNAYSSKVIMIHKSRARRWNVDIPKPLPSFGFDKKGTKLINESANAISKKIDEYLQLNSISTKFDDVTAEAICRTNDFLQFQIFLYESPVKGSTYIEVLKLSGCGFEFKRQRENIMNCLVSNKQPHEHSSTTTVSNSSTKLKIPQTFLNSYVPPRKHDAQSMIERASKQLRQSEEPEDAIFILQNLKSLTTSNAHHPEEYGHWLSLLVMENQNNIQDMIFKIYKQGEGHQLSTSGAVMDEKMSEQVCNTSITIFTNGIIAIYKEEKKNKEFLDQQMKPFIEALVPSLVEKVTNYMKRVETAYLALKCLGVMVCHSQLTRDILQKKNHFENLIWKAKEYGYREHFKLENAAHALLQELYPRDGDAIKNDDMSISEMTDRTETISLSSSTFSSSCYLTSSTDLSMIEEIPQNSCTYNATK